VEKYAPLESSFSSGTGPVLHSQSCNPTELRNVSADERQSIRDTNCGNFQVVRAYCFATNFQAIPNLTVRLRGSIIKGQGNYPLTRSPIPAAPSAAPSFGREVRNLLHWAAPLRSISPCWLCRLPKNTLFSILYISKFLANISPVFFPKALIQFALPPTPQEKKRRHLSEDSPLKVRGRLGPQTQQRGNLIESRPTPNFAHRAPTPNASPTPQRPSPARSRLAATF